MEIQFVLKAKYSFSLIKILWNNKMYNFLKTNSFKDNTNEGGEEEEGVLFF